MISRRNVRVLRDGVHRHPRSYHPAIPPGEAEREARPGRASRGSGQFGRGHRPGGGGGEGVQVLDLSGPSTNKTPLRYFGGSNEVGGGGEARERPKRRR